MDRSPDLSESAEEIPDDADDLVKSVAQAVRASLTGDSIGARKALALVAFGTPGAMGNIQKRARGRRDSGLRARSAATGRVRRVEASVLEQARAFSRGRYTCRYCGRRAILAGVTSGQNFRARRTAVQSSRERYGAQS